MFLASSDLPFCRAARGFMSLTTGRKGKEIKPRELVLFYSLASVPSPKNSSTLTGLPAF